jgi:hypothetical protein
MSYETGTYSDMHDLLSKIRDFLNTNGWTINSFVADASGYQSYAGLDYTGAKRLHVQKTAGDGTVMYFNLKAVTSGIIFSEHVATTSKLYYGGKTRYYSEIRGIGINGSTGYSAEANWDKQPGYPNSGTGTDAIGACITEVPSSGSWSYFIFQNGDSVVVVAEIDAGRYAYLGFGCLTKSCTYTGGQYYAASINSYQPSYAAIYYGYNERPPSKSAFFANLITTYPQNFGLYLNIESDAGWRHCGKEDNVTPDDSEHSFYIHLGGQSPYAKDETIFIVNFNNLVFSRSPNHFNGASILAPVYVFSKRENLRYAYMGYPEGVRIINTNNHNSGDEFTLGSDTWKVFDAYAATDELSNITNLNPDIGFAFLKTT